MSQFLNPLDGGREDIVINNTPTSGIFFSEQYTVVNNFKPVPTEWLAGRRPIYDRLPAASERYKLNFGLDDNSAYPYIPIGHGYTDPSSMVVQTSGENKYLTIQSGNIVWKYGTIPTDPVLIDIELVGMGSAKYLMAYQLYYDDSPIQAQYEVSDFSLSGFRMDIRSGTDEIDGWRYTPQYAFQGDASLYWSNYDPVFLSYTGDASLSWQLSLPCSFSKISLKCPTNTAYTGTATLYHMSCSDATSGEFCESPVWNFWGTTEVSISDNEQFYEFDIEDPILCNGWKVEWSDPKVSIRDVAVSGVVTLEKKPATMTTNYSLVAYPTNSVPDKFTNSLGEEVPLVLCKLAYVDIDSNFTVTKLQDIREVVFNNYEPTAEWLTRPWDENLMNLFDQISNYAEYWMSPTTSMNQEYSKLEKVGVEVNYDKCPSNPYQQI
jgi:hypothetical protein